MSNADSTNVSVYPVKQDADRESLLILGTVGEPINPDVWRLNR